jgi:hypothetical protein
MTSAWRASAGMDAAVASYGALHASAIAASLRVRRALWRRLTFIAAAAIICVSAAHVGLYAFRLMSRFPAIASQFALSLSSIAGAIAYGVLLRRLLNFTLPIAVSAMASILCPLATLAAFTASGLGPGGLWVAAAWWFALSGCLWYADHRRRGDSG